MEEIEVVIKIPKILYAQIQSDAEIMIYSGMRSWKGILATLLRSVRNGTPLPKGHGRIGDLTKLYNEIDARNKGKDKGKYTGILALVGFADTIIEADKEDGGNEKEL